MRQHALTVVTPIKYGQAGALKEFLEREVAANLKRNQWIRFPELSTTHFMRWVVLDENPALDLPATLTMESNHDGPLRDHLDDLLAHGAAGLHEIYRRCHGYPVAGPALPASERGLVREYLIDSAVPYNAYHIGNHHRTVRRIHQENRAREAIQTFLDAEGDRLGSDSRAIRAAIVAHLERTGAMPPAPAPDELPPRAIPLKKTWRGRWQLVRFALPILVPFVAAAAKVVFRDEKRDDELEDPPDAARLARLALREDLQVQNQLTHVVHVKPGIARRIVLRGVLGLIDLFARYEYNQGHLGGIPSIHFGRWVLIDDDKRLVFYSNYDGSWESYLGDFVDRQSEGLTAIWSNTERFPRTRLIFKQGGSRDEERFKHWTRAQQVETQVWWSAYPKLTIGNIQRNGRICAGLRGELNDAELEEWLRWL